MKILLIGNSNDTGAWFGGRKSHEILHDNLVEQFGEPIEIVVKALWPNERAVSRLSDWLEEYQPDLIHLAVNPFWYSYESVPIRMKRVFGKKVGTTVSNAGLSLARKRRLAHNAVFRTIRRWGQRTVGGDTYFTTAQVVDCISDCVRFCVRNEGIILILRVEDGYKDSTMSARQNARKERRRLEVHSALKPLCDQLHVIYSGGGTAVQKTGRDAVNSDSFRVGDGLHSNTLGHEWVAERLLESIGPAILAHQDTAREVAPLAGSVAVRANRSAKRSTRLLPENPLLCSRENPVHRQ